jgi:thioesterase domain-containing protein
MSLHFDDATLSAGAPTALYAIPARAWNGAEYTALQASAVAPALTVVSDPDEARWAEDSVAGIAGRCAEGILERERHGGRRVALLGWSVGALVAVETARLLAGRLPVAWVGLADATHFPDLRAHLAAEAPLTAEVRDQLGDTMTRWLANSSLRDRWQRTWREMRAPQRDLFLRSVVAAHGDGLPTDGAAHGSAEHELWSRVNCLRLGLDYPLAGWPVATHWWASDEVAEASAALRGSSPAGDPGAIEVVPGCNHMTLLADPGFHDRVRRALDAG